MPRYPVESVRRHGRGHGGTPSVMVTLGAPQGGSARYMVFEESAQGPRAVTEIRREGTLQSIHIPMDYPRRDEATRTFHTLPRLTSDLSTGGH